MGIFDRLATLIKSNLNDLISSAENPEKMLNQILVDMREQLGKAKQEVAAAIADEKRLKDQADGEFKQADDWEKRAMLAVQDGLLKLDELACDTLTEWKTDPRKSKITVQVSDLNVSVNGNKATARFRQAYSADSLNVSSRKTLDLVESNGRWLIVREATGG